MTTKMTEEKIKEKVSMYMDFLKEKDTELKDYMLDFIQIVYTGGVIAGTIFECDEWEKELKEKGSVESEVEKSLKRFKADITMKETNKENLKWRLPTKEELSLMYENLHEKGIGNFANTDDYYWSSSKNNSYTAWYQGFYRGYQFSGNELCRLRVRLVLSFESKAGGDLYRIGEEIPYGLVFDIQNDTIFVCKKEDESETMTWYEAMELFRGGQ